MPDRHPRRYVDKLLPGLVLGTVLAAVLAPALAEERILHRERSLYRNIVVREIGTTRCMIFPVRNRDTRQTCIDTEDPNRIVFDYVRMVLAALLVTPQPRRMLIAGLGGGTVPLLLHRLYPDAHIDVVEIDPAVVRVATEYFGFEQNDRMQVFEEDARVFIKRAGRRGTRYDFLLLDAFNGEYIPEHLMTREFLEEGRALLSFNGVFIANTFSSSQLYDHESATYASVFGNIINFRLPSTGNRLIITTGNGRLPDEQRLASRAAALAPKLEPYDVTLGDYLQNLSREVDWDQDKRILTDDYSPANLLQGRR